jgi:hypothetical protein
MREYMGKAKDELGHMREEGGSALGTMVQRGKEWIQNAMQYQRPKAPKAPVNQTQTSVVGLGRACKDFLEHRGGPLPEPVKAPPLVRVLLPDQNVIRVIARRR